MSNRNKQHAVLLLAALLAAFAAFAAGPDDFDPSHIKTLKPDDVIHCYIWGKVRGTERLMCFTKDYRQWICGMHDHIACIDFSCFTTGACNYGTDGNGKSLAPTDDRSWHLLTVSYGGTVSVIDKLTKQEADALRSKLIEWPCGKGVAVCTRLNMPGDIKTAEVFQ